jgi:CarD family transcriptional regulator
MAEPSTVPFAVGDRVVYPNQGVHRVEAIDVKEVAGQRLTFVSLVREDDGAKVMIPEAKVASSGVRKVAGAEDTEALFEFLRSDSDKAVLDWKQRARTNVERMTTGGLHGLGEVVKGLAVLSELRPLPAKERELYDNARHLLVEELATALNVNGCDAEDAVDLILFPPGRERPKRTADEFRRTADDDLDLDADLLGLDTDLGLPDDEEEPEEEEEEHVEEDEEEEAKPKKAPAKKAAPKAKAAPKTKAASKAKASAVELSDDEVTQPMGTALVPEEALPPKRKPGRPAKAKAEADEGEEKPAPKKRGRPPKPKPEGEEKAAPKKRGRPPKAKDS